MFHLIPHELFGRLCRRLQDLQITKSTERHLRNMLLQEEEESNKRFLEAADKERDLARQQVTFADRELSL